MDRRVASIPRTGKGPEISGAQHAAGSSADKKSLTHQPASAETIQALQDTHGESGATVAPSTGIDEVQYRPRLRLPGLPPLQNSQHIRLIVLQLWPGTHFQQRLPVI